MPTHSRPPVARALRFLLGLSLGAILYATLTPSAISDEVPPWWCVACGERGVADFILNVMLFVPLGISLRLNAVRPGTAALTGGVLSTAIELTQAMIPGRDTTIGDVISNTLGTMLGYWLTSVALSVAVRRPRAVVSAVWAIVAIVVVALTGAALRPDYPPTAYYGQWTADLDGGLQWYRGHVLRATLGNLPLPSELLRDQSAIHGLLRDGQTPIHVVLTAGPVTTRIAPVFSIFDDERREILILGARGHDLVVRSRTRGFAWGLDRPYLTERGVLTGLAPGDTLHIAYWRQGGRTCLLINGGRSCDLGYTAGAGWSVLIYPESLPGWLRTLLGALWVGGMLLPAGYSIGTKTGAALTILIIAIGLGGVPPFVGLLRTPTLEWAGALAGLGVGFAARILLSRGVLPSSSPAQPM
ncbi:MAG TPA: VanZ family protein [Gemmatimonadales bacterium]|nr:VanZ family protein [Gemmatimonadales bacterium]